MLIEILDAMSLSIRSNYRSKSIAVSSIHKNISKSLLQPIKAEKIVKNLQKKPRISQKRATHRLSSVMLERLEMTVDWR